MIIREYIQSDCIELTKLFYNTVHTVNAKDYTKEQLNVWATGKVDLEKWNQSLLEHYTLIAVESNRIVGFGDIDKTGYLDRLYIHKDYQRKGITHASITAKGFFEKRRYSVIKQQQVKREGIILINYVMEKNIK